MNNKTHITFIIDRSGSMGSCWDDVIGGYKDFVQKQKAAEGECTFSLIAFDNQYSKPIDGADIQIVTESLDELNIRPRGGTALYDAIGRAINETNSALAGVCECCAPSKKIVVIQTDGYENASREFSASKIKDMIKHQTEKHDWQFMFIGADKNACLSASRDLGINVNTVAWYNEANTKGMMDTINTKLCNARSATDHTAYMASVSYSDEEREQLAESETKVTN